MLGVGGTGEAPTSSCESGVGLTVGEGVSVGLRGKEDPGSFLEPDSTTGRGPGSGGGQGIPDLS